MYEFLDDYVTGIESIDDEHRRLFEIADETYRLSKEEFLVDKYDQVRHILGELKDYALLHFEHEEAYMESINYKKMFMQKVQHDQFREKIIGRLECDHPVFYFLDNHGDEYKEVLGTGKTENLEYTVFGDGIRIDKATGRKIVIPECIEDTGVTSVGLAAFDEFVEEVFLPMTIRDCPDAFILCASLRKLSVPFDVWIDACAIPKATIIERRFS